MPKYVARSRTDATAEAVWPLVSDLTRHGEWSADPLTVTQVEPGVYESVARSKGKEFTARLEVLETVPRQRFVFRATDATGTYEHVFTLTPDGGGTVVTREIDATALSLGQRVLFYVVLPIVKKPNARKALEKLAARATSGL